MPDEACNYGAEPKSQGQPQVPVLRETPVNAVVHAKLGAVQHRIEIAAAHFALERWAVVAVEIGGLKRQRLGFAH